MPKVFEVDEVRKIVGEASHDCAIKLVKEGRTGSSMTRANFKAHKDCIRDVFRQKIKEKIAAL